MVDLNNLFISPYTQVGMARPLNVLFLSSEVEPFAKTGGLADVSAALPLTLRRIGHDIRVMMPRYASITDGSPIRKIPRLAAFPVSVGGQEPHSASLNSSFLVKGRLKVPVYLLENGALFGRRGLYVDPETHRDYPDNDERFIFFCRGILESLKRLGWRPDVIHCNDWHTGLIPAYLRTVYRDDPFFAGVRTVFTIHNMAYQGIFPQSSFARTLLPPELGSESGVLAYGNLNFMKAALLFADTITTVSRRYAEEIQGADEFGFGLQGLLKSRGKDLHGILNGADYSVWDPSADKLIPRRYDGTRLEKKTENKRALLRKMSLPFRPEVPLIGMISRLADQKGFDLLAAVLEDLMKMDIQMVVLGTGEKRYHEMLESAQKTHPAKFAVRLAFDNALAHLIEAGSDMFLMPSRYEPCGLNQIYSLRYGTVPIVRSTGGLDDTIEDVTQSPRTGTGFKFAAYESSALLESIRTAVEAYRDGRSWEKIMKRGMTKDFSWESSARNYVRLYRELLKK